MASGRLTDRGCAGHDLERSRDDSEATEQVGHVRAEDPFVDVRLVEDQEAQCAREGRDLRRRGSAHEPGVHHVRRHRHDLGGGEDGCAPMHVHRPVDEADGQAERLEEGLPLPELVADESLQRIEGERPCLGVRQRQVGRDRHEGEALARRGRGGEADVLARQQVLDGPRLMGVDAIRVDLLEVLPNPGVEAGGRRNADGRVAGDLDAFGRRQTARLEDLHDGGGVCAVAGLVRHVPPAPGATRGVRGL